ncbi:MAG: 8-oxo-dGTP diphosphatase [Polyangiaceae bacterium]
MTEVDWTTWVPTETATLLFVVRGGEILLIRKKRGLGAGKVNGPGGRLDPGETPLQAALREIAEELRVQVETAREVGQLSFQFVDGYKLHCHVFRADDCVGDAVETDEAVPLWTPVDAIPFDEMWADDRLWLPLLLEEKPFRGRFVFDGERMVTCDLVVR